ncbi:hypothetical protein [Deinococcus xinjiangensis]|uniref:hypothetical protein n=1 Tax=Deinococcus xinjiangensis TaxID=457454 RepID=UPI00336544F1
MKKEHIGGILIAISLIFLSSLIFNYNILLALAQLAVPALMFVVISGSHKIMDRYLLWQGRPESKNTFLYKLLYRGADKLFAFIIALWGIILLCFALAAFGGAHDLIAGLLLSIFGFASLAWGWHVLQRIRKP